MKVVHKGHDALQNGEDHLDSILRETGALIRLLKEVKKDPSTGQMLDGYARVYQHGLMEIIPPAPETLIAIAAVEGHYMQHDEEILDDDDSPGNADGDDGGDVVELGDEVNDQEDEGEDEDDLGKVDLGNVHMGGWKNANAVRANLFDVSTWSETDDEDYKASQSSDSDMDMSDGEESDEDDEE